MSPSAASASSVICPFLLLQLLLMLLPSATTAIFLKDPCIDSKVCSCNDSAATIYCDCGAPFVEAKHRLTRLNIWPFTLHRSTGGSGESTALHSITLRRCPSVGFHQAALSVCPPNGVLVESVSQVALPGLAFHEMRDCRRLAFVDVGVTLFAPYAFHAIRRVLSVEFRDATIDVVEALAFVALRDVGALSFVNCRVGALQSLAVSNATRIDRISFVDCDIGELGDEAIVASQVGHFEMVNTTVGRWGRHAVTLVDARKVTVSDNRVRALHAAAFDGLVDAVDVVVAGNDLGGGEDAVEAVASLYAAASTPLPVNWTLVVRDNELRCDADLCQLLSQQLRFVEDGDEAFLALTKCANDTRTLAEFLTLSDDDDECPFGGVASGAGNARPTLDTPASGFGTPRPRVYLFAIVAGATLIAL